MTSNTQLKSWIGLTVYKYNRFITNEHVKSKFRIAQCHDNYENAWFDIEYMIAIQHRYIYTTLKATKTYLRIYVYTFTYLNIHIVRSTTL